MENNTIKIYKEGYKEGCDSKSNTAIKNPYPKDTQEHSLWEMGRVDGCGDNLAYRELKRK